MTRFLISPNLQIYLIYGLPVVNFVHFEFLETLSTFNYKQLSYVVFMIHFITNQDSILYSVYGPGRLHLINLNRKICQDIVSEQIDNYDPISPIQ